MSNPIAIPAVSVTYAQDGTSTRANALGMRPMQERAYQKRGEQYLLIKSPPASGKSWAKSTNKHYYTVFIPNSYQQYTFSALNSPYLIGNRRSPFSVPLPMQN